ncbi:hypothetical protein P9112_001734 [Eukaryota sp. TZLM1-RC]
MSFFRGLVFFTASAGLPLLLCFSTLKTNRSLLCCLLLSALFHFFSLSFFSLPFSFSFFPPCISLAVSPLCTIFTAYIIYLTISSFSLRLLKLTSLTSSFSPRFLKYIFLSSTLGLTLAHYTFTYLPIIARSFSFGSIRAESCQTLSLFVVVTIKSLVSATSQFSLVSCFFYCKLSQFPKRGLFCLSLVYFVEVGYYLIYIAPFNCQLFLVIYLVFSLGVSVFSIKVFQRRIQAK